MEVSWYQKAQTLSLEVIRNAGVHGDEAIIDVGGGVSCWLGHKEIDLIARSRRGDQAYG